jgi:hypothetical protein
MLDHNALGPGIDAREPVLKTDFALNLVNDYIHEQSGPPRPGQDINTPFFDRQQAAGTMGLYPFGIADQRPRARN